MDYVPHTDDEVAAMLADIGLSSLDELWEAIPEALRLAGGLDVAPGRSEPDTLAELERLAEKLSAAGALGGASDHGTTKSLYAKDPDGLEFEVAWIVPADQIDDGADDGRQRIGPLDLPRELARYGAETRGGVGISH